ncbi:type II toxin-antitoxin system RelE/ParE family toxin [Candidatus Collierbacteria bacterium]|nr:type II toxin-antitoxin system RelE/ParE family toxin [Candidatus Collierbacteria bacterium]
MLNSWQVAYYISPSRKIPVKEFLDATGPKLKTKAFLILMHVQEYGLQAITPHVKKLIGIPLWEIRILGGDNARILFVTQLGKQVLLLHAFIKKTNKTPVKEIAIALKRLELT